MACEIRAWTVWPEWAACMVLHGKRIENRPRPLPRSLWGQRIALHAGAHVGGRPGRPARREAQQALRSTGLTWLEIDRALRWADLNAGKLYATVRVGEPLSWREVPPAQSFWCVKGQVWNPLYDFRELKPPEGPIRGKQGYWRTPITTQIRQHLEAPDVEVTHDRREK